MTGPQVNLSVDDLLDYTSWQRGKWYALLRQHGDQILATSAGPNGDGRFGTVGELIRHLFSAEQRYVERLTYQPLSDTAAIPADSVEALFEFGRESRRELVDLLESFADEEWEVPREFEIVGHALTATPKKIVMHVLMHEIRHWAQIATLLRLSGIRGEFHDLLFSPVLDSTLP